MSNRPSTTSVHWNAYARPSIWPCGFICIGKASAFNRDLSFAIALLARVEVLPDKDDCRICGHSSEGNEPNPLTVYSNTLGVFLIGYKPGDPDDLEVEETSTNLSAFRAVTVTAAALVDSN